jgi:hypothetical protein
MEACKKLTAKNVGGRTALPDLGFATDPHSLPLIASLLSKTSRILWCSVKEAQTLAGNYQDSLNKLASMPQQNMSSSLYAQ